MPDTLHAMQHESEKSMARIEDEVRSVDRKLLAICRSLDVMTMIIAGLLCLILWRVW